MGPPTETPKTGTGKNKIRIKPSTTLSPANVNAKTIGEIFDERRCWFDKLLETPANCRVQCLPIERLFLRFIGRVEDE